MMKKLTIILVALIFSSSSLLMTSCAKKQLKTEEEITKPVAPPPKKEEPKVVEDDAAKKAAEEARRQRELEAQKLRAAIRVFESAHIYFDFDKSELKPAARANLAKKAGWLQGNPDFSVRIEGHCDERGTNEYNLALGERRANAARKYLNLLGVSGGRLSIISYGEEKSADLGHNEDAWARNRRDEFKVIK